MAFAGWSQRAPLSGVEVERRIERLADQQGKDLYSFVICLLADHRPIGEATLGDLDLHNGSALVGIVIGEPAAWGKGYGTDAVNALVDFAFGELRSGCGSTSGRRTRGHGVLRKGRLRPRGDASVTIATRAVSTRVATSCRSCAASGWVLRRQG